MLPDANNITFHVSRSELINNASRATTSTTNSKSSENTDKFIVLNSSEGIVDPQESSRNSDTAPTTDVMQPTLSDPEKVNKINQDTNSTTGGKGRKNETAPATSTKKRIIGLDFSIERLAEKGRRLATLSVENTSVACLAYLIPYKAMVQDESTCHCNQSELVVSRVQSVQLCSSLRWRCISLLRQSKYKLRVKAEDGEAVINMVFFGDVATDLCVFSVLPLLFQDTSFASRLRMVKQSSTWFSLEMSPPI
ncbi:uncharacterized protein [Lolium perenne]|uniref:uncharacterized protein isoform X1 n=1 Tax=Lolium perenne TaxID=4522 RepID=UPI003A9A1B04